MWAVLSQLQDVLWCREAALPELWLRLARSLTMHHLSFCNFCNCNLLTTDNLCVLYTSVVRSISDCSGDMRVSLSIWYVCQRGVRPVWGLLAGVCLVSGHKAMPPLSQWALPAKRSVCAGVWEVLVMISHLLTYVLRRDMQHHLLSI